MKKVLKSAAVPRPQMISIKVSKLEHQRLKAKARKWAGGSMSDWVRYACLELEPKMEDLTEA